MSGARALWLIGFRAAGKTTVGREFAKAQGWRFLDLDEEFERRHGEILSFVHAHGLEAFRAREEALLREASESPALGLTIATGGGFVDREASRKIVAASAWPKAWLDPPAEVLWARLEKAPDRRKIGGLHDFSAMSSLLEKRRPFYEEIATSRSKSQDISDCLALLQSLVVGNS